MALAVKKSVPKPSPQDWLSVKNDIERLYVFECHNLRYVAQVLKHRHDFNATLRMFKSRIKEWNFDQKTIRQADWRFMFHEYIERKKLNPSKDTIFRVCQDRHGRVIKYKTIKHIRTYMRRKQVTEDDFLSSPPGNANFSHIQPITPPLSPALSSASTSPPSQIDGYNVDAATPPSLTDAINPSAYRFASSGLQHPTTDESRLIHRSQAVVWPPDHHPHHHHQVTIANFDNYMSSQRETSRAQVHSSLFGRCPETFAARHNSARSPTKTNQIMLQGSQRMAIQTFALDKQDPSEDVELYRSVARSPSQKLLEGSDSDDDLSAIDLARTFSDFDEDAYDERGKMSVVHVPSSTDIISARLQAFKPDVDEARAFRWASMYFLACILQGRTKFALADAARASATKVFERMLTSETRSPNPVISPTYVPSHRSRFILSGLTLMATVLKAHGRDDMLKKFLVDSLHSIAKFFQMDNHPLSAPYLYLLCLMDNKPIDDEAWERTLRGAHTTIHHVWNGGPNAVVSHYYWAWHILKRNRYAEAIEQLKTCYEKASAMFGEFHILTINCLSTIARALFDQELYDEARPQLADTIMRSQKALGPDHPFCYKLIERMGDLEQRLGDLASAEKTYQRVVEGRKKSLGLHHGHTSYAVHKLAEVLHEQGKLAERDQLVRDLDEEHRNQQKEHWATKERYFPDSRQSHFTHPSLDIRTLIGLH